MSLRANENADELFADTIAWIAQEVLEEHMALGTSGRYLTTYGVSPADLAEMIALRIVPSASTGGDR